MSAKLNNVKKIDTSLLHFKFAEKVIIFFVMIRVVHDFFLLKTTLLDTDFDGFIFNSDLLPKINMSPSSK